MDDSSIAYISSSSRRDEDSGWSSLGGSAYLKIAVIGVLFWYFFRDDVDRIVNRWVTDPSWSHGFLIPLFSLYFLNQHKSEIIKLETRANYLGLVFLLCCIIIYPLNSESHLP